MEPRWFDRKPKRYFCPIARFATVEAGPKACVLARTGDTFSKVSHLTAHIKTKHLGFAYTHAKKGPRQLPVELKKANRKAGRKRLVSQRKGTAKDKGLIGKRLTTMKAAIALVPTQHPGETLAKLSDLFGTVLAFLRGSIESAAEMLKMRVDDLYEHAWLFVITDVLGYLPTLFSSFEMFHSDHHWSLISEEFGIPFHDISAIALMSRQPPWSAHRSETKWLVDNLDKGALASTRRAISVHLLAFCLAIRPPFNFKGAPKRRARRLCIAVDQLVAILRPFWDAAADHDFRELAIAPGGSGDAMRFDEGEEDMETEEEDMETEEEGSEVGGGYGQEDEDEASSSDHEGNSVVAADEELGNDEASEEIDQDADHGIRKVSGMVAQPDSKRQVDAYMATMLSIFHGDELKVPPLVSITAPTEEHNFTDRWLRLMSTYSSTLSAPPHRDFLHDTAPSLQGFESAWDSIWTQVLEGAERAADEASMAHASSEADLERKDGWDDTGSVAEEASVEAGSPSRPEEVSSAGAPNTSGTGTSLNAGLVQPGVGHHGIQPITPFDGASELSRSANPAQIAPIQAASTHRHTPPSVTHRDTPIAARLRSHSSNTGATKRRRQ